MSFSHIKVGTSLDSFFFFFFIAGYRPFYGHLKITYCVCASGSPAGPGSCVVMTCSVSLISDDSSSPLSLTGDDQKVLKKLSHMGHRGEEKVLDGSSA